jgi:hypothetical protein
MRQIEIKSKFCESIFTSSPGPSPPEMRGVQRPTPAFRQTVLFYFQRGKIVCPIAGMALAGRDKELSGNKSYKFIGDVFCGPKPETGVSPKPQPVVIASFYFRRTNKRK